jgi:hypothetical protein
MYQDYTTDLSDLVGFGFGTSRLQVQYVRDSLPREDMIAASNTFVETQILLEPT